MNGKEGSPGNYPECKDCQMRAVNICLPKSLATGLGHPPTVGEITSRFPAKKTAGAEGINLIPENCPEGYFELTRVGEV